MVRIPSDMLALGDGVDRSPDLRLDGDFGPPWFMPRTMADTRTEPQYSVFPYKEQPTYKSHHGKFNRAFCDGHIEVEDFNRPFSDTDTYLKRYNIDNEPHRDLWLRAGRRGKP